MAIHSFDHVGGTETYVLTVAEQLQRLGHWTRIYTLRLGDMGRLAHERAVDVVDDPVDLGASYDVILSQDAGMAYELADRYPDVPQVFVHHSPLFDPQQPPLVPGVVDAVVVMSQRFRNGLEALGTDLRIVRLRQPIDAERLVPRRSPSPVPRRALLLGNYLAGDARRLLVDTWTDMGLEVVQVGTVTRSTLQPEEEIAAADIVVGKSRAVLDAMSCGRPVYVYDAFGGDGWVTADTYDAIEADAIAGMAFPGVIDADRLRKDLAQYDPAMGHVNRTLVLKNHHARTHVIALVRLFREVSSRAADAAPTTEARELARQIRLRWRAEEELIGLRPAVQAAAERQQAAAEEHRVELAQARVDEAAALQAVRLVEARLLEVETELGGERAARLQVERRRDRARARGRRLHARYAALLAHPWVRLGMTLRLLPRPDRRER